MNSHEWRKMVIGALCLSMLTSLIPFAWGETNLLSTGKLVLSGARSVYEADLQTKRIEVVPGLDNISFIYHQLTKVDDERFLYALYIDEQIYEYNRKTHTTKLVRTGSMPTYVAEHGKFVFYHHDPVAKRMKLYVADLKEPVTSAREVGQGLKISESPVIQVSRDEIIFTEYVNEHKLYKIRRYNLVTHDLNALPLKNCYPAIWRSATRQLLCSDKQGYYLTNLDGTDVQPLPELKDDIAEAYVPEYDTLILGKVRLELLPWPRGERHSVWAYHFKERKMVRLFKETASGGKATVIWYER